MFFKIDEVGIEAIAGAVSENRIPVQTYMKGLCEEKKLRRTIRGTGFEKLSVVKKDVHTSDLCFASAEKIFAQTNIRKEEISALLFVSQTPDFVLPATSHILQHRLGLSTDVVALDIGLGCSGFVYGLYVAAILFKSLSKGKVLLLAGDTSAALSEENLSSRPLFGDGGSAAIVGRKEAQEMLFHINTFGERHTSILMRHPVKNDGVGDAKNDNIMDGEAIMEFALKDVPVNIEKLLSTYGIKKEKVNLFVFHQANKIILESLISLLGIRPEKVPFAAAMIGNTSSASIPLVLTERYSDSINSNLKKVLLSGFGVGLSIATSIVDLSETQILKTVEI